MMTKRQRDALRFIERYVAEHGLAPSFEEIRIALGIKNKSGVARIMAALNERGIIASTIMSRSTQIQPKATTFGFFEPTPSQALELAEAQRRYGARAWSAA